MVPNNERLAQLYHFAELGKQSMAIFHDLMGFLQVLAIHAEHLGKDDVTVSEFQECVINTMQTSRRMREFLEILHRQIKPALCKKPFSLRQEITTAIAVLSHKSRANGIIINVDAPEDIIIFGNAFKFQQIVSNLLRNAIDAYNGVSGKRKEVLIRLDQHDKTVLFRITDHGCGIKKSIQEKIFDPFFTTKQSTCGIGLGLAIIKESIERDFEGSITVSSNEGGGTMFSITIPQLGGYWESNPD